MYCFFLLNFPVCVKSYMSISHSYIARLLAQKKKYCFFFFLENVGIKGVDMLYENAEV